MIDELELIKSIIEQLSGAGLWLWLVYVGYLLVIKALTILGVLWLVKYMVDAVSTLLTPGITKKDADKIIFLRDRQQADHYAQVQKLKADIDKIKHQYKILKESKDNEHPQ